MAHKAKKHKPAAKAGKRIREEDLLPESQEFLGSRAEERIIYKDMPTQENEDKYKRMIMWSGISFFMILILVIWGYNLKKNFDLSIGNAKEGQSWGDISKELDKVMETIKENTDNLGQLAAESQATSTATTTNEVYNMASIAELRKDLESASTTEAATTQSAVKKKK